MKHMRLLKLGALALAFLLVTAVFGCAPSVQEEPVDSPALTDAPAKTEIPVNTEEPVEDAGPVVPDFSSADIDGNEATNAVFKNAEITFVNIWGTFCSPCIDEMPDLGELAEAYADKGVQFIGIIADASAETAEEIELAKEIREQTGADYLHILNSQSVSDAMLKGVNAVPTTFFVNSQGQVIGETYVGSRSYAEWAKILDELIAAQG